MKYALTLFTLGLFSLSLSAQLSSTEAAELLIDQQKTAAAERAGDDQAGPFSGTNESTFSIADLDDDGMDDDWEIANGLDPNDPNDAWGDLDNDEILNLFEFQLQTAVNNPASPIAVQITPNGGAMAVDAALDFTGRRVIKLSQGVYTGQMIHFYSENYRLMIQGGWNDDFTERDPELYPTYLQNDGAQALYIATSSDGPLSLGTLVLDGINVTAANHFSLNGGTNLNLDEGSHLISIIDCRFDGGTEYGLSIIGRDPNGTQEVRMARTSLGNNLNGGIYTQITGGHDARWKFFNTTIHNPISTEGGIDGLTNSGSTLEINLLNCINWGNSDFALNFNSFHLLTVNLEHTNIDSLREFINVEDSIAVINADPLFVNAAEGDFHLQPASPCIDSGIVVGLAFAGSAPDLGAFEFTGGCVSTNDTLVVNACGSYEYNGIIYFSGITRTDTLTNVGGCDSVVTLDLTVEIFDAVISPAPASAVVQVMGDLDSFGYQWVDCSTNLDIPGANAASYFPEQSGNYAVRINSPNCEVLTACVGVIISAVNETDLFLGLVLSPNPTRDRLRVDLGVSYPELTATVYDSGGKQLLEAKFAQQRAISLPVQQLPAGVYLLRLTSEAGSRSLRFVKR